MSYIFDGLRYTLDNQSNSYALGDYSNTLRNAVVGSISSDLVIPNSIQGLPVTKILTYALYGQALSSISFPDSLIEIKTSGIDLCGLKIDNLELPSSLKIIGGNAFSSNQIKKCQSVRILNILEMAHSEIIQH